MGVVRLLVNACTAGHHVSRTYTLFLFISMNWGGGGVAVSGHILDTKGSLVAHIINL